MARCPECQSEQGADFGMTTCSQCGTVFMVGIDGKVEVASVEENSPSETAEFMPEPQEESFGETPADYLEPELEEVPRYEEPALQEEPVIAASEPEESYSEDFLDDLSDSKQEKISQTDPLEVQRFDEAGGTDLEAGEYLYDVVITGIDSADIKKDVLHALSEKRFALSLSDLQKELHKGELRIPHLNPVRAMLIVLRLQSFDLTVEWYQKHFTQEENKTESEAEV